MTRIIYICFIIIFPFNVLIGQAGKNANKLTRAQSYIFFLHNKFIEEHPLSEEHPEYGRAQYVEVLDDFRDANFTVFSEKRPVNTDSRQYAEKIVLQIDSLLQLGVKSNHITVIGTSKGGYIAQLVSTYMKNPNVNFVFIGCYRESDLKDLPLINFCGNILTIYERTDAFGVSAIKRKETSNLKVTRFKEIELNTGLRHGFLFKPMKEWVEPTKLWAKRKYKKVDTYSTNY